MIDHLFNATELDFPVILFRLMLSLFIGGFIGWEREGNMQHAGLRTHILICVGSTVIMLLSIYIPQEFSQFGNSDPSRIAAQVVSGIGFLGAGAIFKIGANVKGITTAASIWAIAAIGMAIGAGMYATSIIAALMVYFSLSVLNKVEKYFFTPRLLKTLTIEFEGGNIKVDNITTILKKYNIKIESVNIMQSYKKNETKVNFIIHIPRKVMIEDLYAELNHLQGVSEIILEQHI